MGSRFKDFFLLLALVATGAYWLRPQPNAPQTTPTPGAAATERASTFPDLAPPFELHSNLGPPRQFDGKGPLIITLTAVQCGGCLERIPRDKQLYELAKKAKIPYYNALVYVADDAAGAKFVKDHHPEADDILNDPGGQVFVNQYLGSDNNCWMVIGPKGEFRYRGPENMEAMQQAIYGL